MLQPVGNRPIICHVLEEMRRADVDRVALLIAAEDLDQTRSYIEAERVPDIKVSYLPWEPTGRSDLDAAMAAAVELVGGAACVLHAAEGLLQAPLSRFFEHLRHSPVDLEMLVEPVPRSYDSIGLATIRLAHVAANPRSAQAVGQTGVCLFGPGGLQRAGGARWWPAGELDFVDAAERLVEAGGGLRLQRTHGWLRYTGQVQELLELNRLALDRLAHEALSRAGSEPDVSTTRVAITPKEDGNNQVEGWVRVDPGADVRSSVLIGPAIIGADAIVTDSYVGPYTSIGEHASIEGAEVERSIIMDGARIMHLGGRLVASVVGRDAHVFRDFSLPRALRINVGKGSEVALC